MATTVAHMTKEELREIIETIIEQKLLEVFGDLDEGALIRQVVRERLLGQSQSASFGEHRETSPSQSEPPELVDKEGVLVVRAEPLRDLTNITQHARELRIFDLVQRTGL
jgi:hypothetical protein